MRVLSRFARRFRRNDVRGRAAAPGPHNTTTLVFTDQVVRAQDEPLDEATKDDAGLGSGDPAAEATGPGTPFRGEPIVRWVVRTAQAASHRVRVLVPGDPDQAPDDAVQDAWRPLLPRDAAGTGAQARKTSGRAKRTPALALWPSGDGALDRRPRLETALPRIEDPYVLLLDARMPTVGPDLLLALQSRLSSHDAVAFHLDGWWVAEPSLWRRDALAEALDTVARAGHRDLPALLDMVDARPLDEGFLAAVTAERPDLRCLHTVHDVRRHEGTMRR